MIGGTNKDLVLILVSELFLSPVSEWSDNKESSFWTDSYILLFLILDASISRLIK